jgi:DNA-binding NtrC family response regulator
MEDPICAVMIQDEFESLVPLAGVLGDLSLETHCANGFKEARRLITRHQPHMVFVNQSQWCDYFEEIVWLANSVDHVFNIIVVGPIPQVEWRASAIAHGAFDYVAPPFTHEILTGVVHSAVLDVVDRREALARALHP